jgi:hypothetical protein
MSALAVFIVAPVLGILTSLIGLRCGKDDLSQAARLLLEFARRRELLKPNDEERSNSTKRRRRGHDRD